MFQALQARFPDRLAYVPDPDPGLIERLYAGSGIYLMPSRFEPCGWIWTQSARHYVDLYHQALALHAVGE